MVDNDVTTWMGAWGRRSLPSNAFNGGTNDTYDNERVSDGVFSKV